MQFSFVALLSKPSSTWSRVARGCFSWTRSCLNSAWLSGSKWACGASANSKICSRLTWLPDAKSWMKSNKAVTSPLSAPEACEAAETRNRMGSTSCPNYLNNCVRETMKAATTSSEGVLKPKALTGFSWHFPDKVRPQPTPYQLEGQ